MKLVIRPSREMATKSASLSQYYERVTFRAMQACLAAHHIRAQFTIGHHVWYCESDDLRVPILLQRVFGVGSLSIIEAESPAEKSEILAVGKRTFSTHVEGRVFRVKVKRAGVHHFTSIEIERELGALLAPRAKGVSLTDPQVTATVEVRNKRAFFYMNQIQGAHGLPPGPGGRALVLLSGGFDSVVAAWQIASRGIKVDFLFFNLSGRANERSVLMVAKHLQTRWLHGYDPCFTTVDFSEFSEQLKKAVPSSRWQVSLKAAMLSFASDYARKNESEALVTGDSLGQVSSQTLQNMAVLERYATLPIVRPLVGTAKDSIVKMSAEIGVRALCEQVAEHCSLGSKNPSAKVRPEDVEGDLQHLQEHMNDDGLRVNARPMSEISPRDFEAALMVDEVPQGARVLDLRGEHDFGRWRYPGSEQVDFNELFSQSSRLVKKATYVLSCDLSTKSQLAAERLQNRGFEAYCLRGGTRRLRQLERHP